MATADDFRSLERSQIPITDQHRRIITEGMAGAVRTELHGARNLIRCRYRFWERLERRLPAKGFRTNGWFIGFAAPFSKQSRLDPSQVDLAVLVLTSRAHGAEAAMIARPIFESICK